MKNKTPLGMHDIMDLMYAELLDITVADYQQKIETLSENRQEIILLALVSGHDKKIQQARKIFNSIPIDLVSAI